MAIGLQSNSLVFLVDDRKGAWFQAMAAVMQRNGWRCGPEECFDKEYLGESLDGPVAVDRFRNFIEQRLSTEESATFAVITDSEYADVQDAGAQLIKLLRYQSRFAQRFAYGVIYSARPKGVSEPGVVELVERRAGDVALDARQIADFFLKGSFASARRIVELLDELTLFWWPITPAAFDRVYCYGADRLFRPVGDFGHGLQDVPHRSYFCDPILERFGATPTLPFSGETQRWFESTAFSDFVDYFDPNGAGDEIAVANRVCEVLSPSRSMKQAKMHIHPSQEQYGNGSLRLLFDLVLSGGDTAKLSAEYRRALRPVMRYPRDADFAWNLYVDVLQEFLQQSDVQAAFRKLWAGAMEEMEALVQAAQIARKRIL